MAGFYGKDHFGDVKRRMDFEPLQNGKVTKRNQFDLMGGGGGGGSMNVKKRGVLENYRTRPALFFFLSES